MKDTGGSGGKERCASLVDSLSNLQMVRCTQQGPPLQTALRMRRFFFFVFLLWCSFLFSFSPRRRSFLLGGNITKLKIFKSFFFFFYNRGRVDLFPFIFSSLFSIFFKFLILKIFYFLMENPNIWVFFLLKKEFSGHLGGSAG